MSLVGNLEDLGLSDIFQIIFLSRRSGVLAIRGKVVEGKIYFKDGMVIAAYSLDASKKMIHDNARDTVFSLFIEEGNFDFELKDPAEEIKGMKQDSLFAAEPGLNPQFLAMEGSRLLDEAKAKMRTAPLPPPPVEQIPPLPQQAVLPLAEPQIEEAPPKEAEISAITHETMPQAKEESFSPRSIWAEAGIAEEERVEPVVASPGLALLRSMIFELQNPHSSSEITLMILRFASEIMNRAVLFIVKRDTIEGLGQFGVVIKNGDLNRRIKGIKIQVSDGSIFKEVVLKKMTIKKKLEAGPVHEYIVKALGGHWPNEVFLAPLLVSGKVAALLYGDNVPEEKPIGDTESLEIFLAQAGIAMERALLERRLSMKGKE
ncbi:MAG: DUF4388 domain-containing protein [Deltaproteobacteria bacterium]|nr:DUF4388 domain-containing protein [Deltaproteobacteria bacterium]